MPAIAPILQAEGFPAPYLVQGRESIANLFPRAKRSGVYVLHCADETYYVGKSVNVVGRYVQHRRNHPDIIWISFKQVPKSDHLVAERQLKHLLQQHGFALRGSEDIDLPYPQADFDLLMTPIEQERWRSDCSLVDLSGSRMVNSPLRSTYHGKFLRLQQQPYFADVVEVLCAYAQIGLPRAQATEESFWACSCLPTPRVHTRVNIHWQEVLTAWIPQDEIYFSFHTALIPLSIGSLLSNLFRVCKPIQLRLTCNETYVDESPTGESIGQLLLGFIEDDPDEEIVPGYAVALDQALSAFFCRHPNVQIQNSQYVPGGWNQVRLVVGGAEDALRLLGDNEVGLAIRDLNLRLMRKGPSPYRSSHCLVSIVAREWLFRNFRETGLAQIGYTTTHRIMVSRIIPEVYDSIALPGLAGVCRSAPGQPGHHRHRDRHHGQCRRCPSCLSDLRSIVHPHPQHLSAPAA